LPSIPGQEFFEINGLTDKNWKANGKGVAEFGDGKWGGNRGE
jgi:hypothetical protein